MTLPASSFPHVQGSTCKLVPVCSEPRNISVTSGIFHGFPEHFPTSPLADYLKMLSQPDCFIQLGSISLREEMTHEHTI